SRLSMQARLVTVDSQMVTQFIKTVEKAGYQVSEVLINSLVVAQGVLSTVEKELGTALVDLGGGTTAITVFKRGTLVDMTVLPVGGEHITSDLAIGVRTSLEAAEKVKRDIGLLPQEGFSVELPSMGGLASRRVSLAVIRQIIESRVLEILDLIKQSIARIAPGNELPGGVVFTGSGSCLKGLADLASRVLQLPVRLASAEPESQAARFLARHAVTWVSRRENQRLAVAAGEFRFGPRGMRQIFAHLRRNYLHGGGIDG
ncbi:cell division FtsA domain-containing protein, partial [Desulfofundulus sp.]|uniref:cell division FtsA domain-containing protein n=1 Tax=Desulfofundulus sp. TaxID=2282750 RepID=UPI003C7165EF